MRVTVALRAAGRSHTGPRPDNQDSGLAGPALVAVADGVGGNVGGAVASSLVVSWLAPLALSLLADEPDGGLARVVAGADERIAVAYGHRPRLRGMATTMTAIGVLEDRCVLAHIGDSRAYRLRDGALLQVTRDHTLIQALMDAGSITEEEALVHPQRSAVYAALHGSPEDLAGLEVSWLDVAVGDRLLVCSDGLSGALAPQTIADLLDEAEDPESAAVTLLAAALSAPAQDNVTVVVADVVAGGTAPAGRLRTVGAAAHGRDETVEVLEAQWPGPAGEAFRAVLEEPERTAAGRDAPP